MFSYSLDHKGLCGLIFAIGLFSCVSCNAERGGVYSNGGGYERGNDYNNDNNVNRNAGEWADPVVVTGVPNTGYLNADYPPSCTNVQQCDSNGNCVQSQSCN